MGKRMLQLKYRIIFFILTCLAILTADLSIAIINKYVLSYKNRIGRHYAALIGIAVILVIFYIFVSNINRVSVFIINKFVHITRIYLGRVIGLYIGIAIIALLLYSGYYWVWFDINLFDEIILFLRRMLHI